jgi:hypothetical protein
VTVISRLSVRSAVSTHAPGRRSAALATCLTLLVAGPLAAQNILGYAPEKSPYRDVDSQSELSIFSGYLIDARDLAGVEPQSAPVVGIREMVHLGGPAIFYARVTHSFSQRTVIDPESPESFRDIGTTSAGLTILDLNLGLNFTGDRSWHNLMPYFGLGPGVVSDLGAPRDAGKYRFGTAFAATYGGGFRWVTSSRFSFHVDMNAYLWAYHYPPTYHYTATDGTQVIPTAKHLIGWRNNGLPELGISYQIF